MLGFFDHTGQISSGCSSLLKNDGILLTCILQSCSFQFVQSFIVELAFLEQEQHHVLALGVATFGAAMFALYANVSRLFSGIGSWRQISIQWTSLHSWRNQGNFRVKLQEGCGTATEKPKVRTFSVGRLWLFSLLNHMWSIRSFQRPQLPAAMVRYQVMVPEGRQKAVCKGVFGMLMLDTATMSSLSLIDGFGDALEMCSS